MNLDDLPKNVSREDLAAFAEQFGLSQATQGRHSLLFIIMLYVRSVGVGDIHPFKVIREIQALEDPTIRTHTKPPAPFKKSGVLGGLMHKHHQESGIASFARNLQLSIKKHGLPALDHMADEASLDPEPRYLSEQDLRKIAQDAVHGAYIRRSEANALTGEWIVYAVHEGKNYYLALWQHEGGDDKLRWWIEQYCFSEFPFLLDLMRS